MKNTAILAVVILLYSYTATAQHVSQTSATQKSILSLRSVISITFGGTYTTNTTTKNNVGNINKKNTGTNGYSGVTKAGENTTDVKNKGKHIYMGNTAGINISATSNTGYTDLVPKTNNNKYNTTAYNEGKKVTPLKRNPLDNNDRIIYKNNLLRINSNTNYLFSVKTNKVPNPVNTTPFAFLTEVIYTATQY